MSLVRLRRIAFVLRRANLGVGLRDKRLALYLATWAMLDRPKPMKRRLLERLNRIATRAGELRLSLRFPRANALTFAMRAGNVGDYAIGAELVREPYALPDFTPRSIVDGGAHIGTFAAYAHAHFPGIPITCYEPDPDNFRQLTANLALGRVDADAKQLGLWSEAATLRFVPGESQLGRIGDDGTVTIDCVLPEIGPDCWLKLDVEGAETTVIPALLRTGRLPRWISLELHDFAGQGAAVMRQLREHGYTVRGTDEVGLGIAVIEASRRAGAEQDDAVQES